MCLPSLSSLFSPPEINIPQPLTIPKPTTAPVAAPIETAKPVSKVSKLGRRRFKTGSTLGDTTSGSGLGLPTIG